MMDLLEVLLLMAGIACIVIAVRDKKKVFYPIGIVLLIGSLAIIAYGFGIGFGEGMMKPR